MKLDAIHELITAAKALTPTGEIGDGKVAHFHHLAELAQAQAAAIPSPYTHFIEGKHLHRVEVDPARSLITVNEFAYSIGLLAGDLVTPAGVWLQFSRGESGGLRVLRAEESGGLRVLRAEESVIIGNARQRADKDRIEPNPIGRRQCAHGNPLNEHCRNCDREHREATA